MRLRMSGVLPQRGASGATYVHLPRTPLPSPLPARFPSGTSNKTYAPDDSQGATLLSLSFDCLLFSPRPPHPPPARLPRYHVLVSKYGRLAPLAEVDLTPRGPTVEVRCGDRVEAVRLTTEQTVGALKKQLRALLQLPPSGVRLFHIFRAEAYAAPLSQEMQYPGRALHSYGIRDGDEILVVPKAKARCHSADC